MEDDKKKTVVDYQNLEISSAEQEILNKPLTDDSGVDPDDKAFLDMIVKKIEHKEIDPLRPESLINHPVYDRLDAQAQGKADLEAFNMLATIRDIYKLWQNGDTCSYQIQYLVHKVRMHKEKLEEVGGDIFII